MKTAFLLTAAFLSFSAVSAVPAPVPAAVPAAVQAAAGDRLSGFDAELAAAKQRKRVLFLQLDAPEGNAVGRAMEETVFSRRQWTRFADRKLICVRLGAGDARAAALRKQFGVKTLPAYLMFAADGRCVGRPAAGKYSKPRRFVSLAEDIVTNADAVMPAPDAVDADGWMWDFPTAQAKARKLNRPVILQFTGSDWCGFCMRMDRQVFSKDAWKTYAAAHLVAVKADSPAYRPMAMAQREKNEALAKRFGVSGVPTYLVFDARGKLLGRLGSSADATPESFIAEAEALLKR